MEIYIVLTVFILAYIFITIEHTIKIDKLVPALAAMAICWAIVALNLESFKDWFNPYDHKLVEGFGELDPSIKSGYLEKTLLYHLGKTAEILVFLIGAMTIVEIVDYFNGFSVFQRIINLKTKKGILWMFSVLAFILSAIIDNLTATIVLISILQKVVSDKELRLWYAGIIIIAANAGGAWSPIGDVTTTMLWIAKKVSTIELISYLLVPSIICMLVSSGIASLLPVFKGDIKLNSLSEKQNKYSLRMLVLGLLAIISVPVFKIVTGLPPYVGMMLALGTVSVFAEIYSNREFALSKVTAPDLDGTAVEKQHHHSPVHKALTKIELPSILFFLGILMAVAALESLGVLYNFADQLKSLPNLGTEYVSSEFSDILPVFLGIASALIDNVPLVAASIGMFSVEMNDQLWHFIAYTAGTGGSMIIIGSAAGVVAMGMEKINFFWYLKKISWIAFIGFISGAATFMIIRNLFI
tara:strand:+ start:1377 stop:2783 length:1407 start_codon:yes stop_codon:yes gene_type:complete